MRIRSYTLPSNPCDHSSGGQVEDYSIIILDEKLCTGTPNPGATTSTVAPPVLGSQSFTLGFANAQNFNGISYQWQRSLNGSTWTDISNATNATYPVSGITATT